MCGIAGVYREHPVSRELIKSMTDAIAHRGPDGEGYYVDGNLAMGHRRLAILDLSPAGAQPMATDDGRFVIVFNGEIYNHLELKKELQNSGCSFNSRSDTEVLLQGYRVWGTDLISKLNGMFAFALWDKVKRQLILARDRFGVKPLYIWVQGKQVVFGSEIKAILKYPGYTMGVNPEALDEYFTFQNLFRTHTLFKDIHHVAPATFLVVDADFTFRSHTYWDYDFNHTDSAIDFETARSGTLDLFRQAVERQMMADVRVGSYLSGGMDSGSVAAVASGKTPRLATFTCGFDMSTTTGREANFDERKDAELMSSFFKTEHYEQVINAGDLSWSMPHLVWHLEDLRVGMSYPNYYIAGLASKFVKVCLTGTGGDELYGGYPWRYYRVFRSLDSDNYYKEYYSFWQRLVPDEDKNNFFAPHVVNDLSNATPAFDIFRSVFEQNRYLRYDTPEDHITNSLYFEAKTFLSSLLIVGDKLSMAHSLEERFPFLDNDLVNFAQKIPVQWKLGNLEKMKTMDENESWKLRKFYNQFDDGKNVLRQSMRQLIPEAIITRQKQGFSAPDESWYRGENLNYVKATLLHNHAASREFIQRSYIEKIINEHVDKKINHRLLIWSFLSFEWWCKIFLEGYSIDDQLWIRPKT